MSDVQFLHFGFSHAAKLGSQLADLHLENKKLGEGLLKEAGTVGKGPSLEKGLQPAWAHGWGNAVACADAKARVGTLRLHICCAVNTMDVMGTVCLGHSEGQEVSLDLKLCDVMVALCLTLQKGVYSKLFQLSV